MDIFKLFIGFIGDFLNVLNSKFYLTAFGLSFKVSLLGILVVFLVLSMIITIFWKGAKG